MVKNNKTVDKLQRGDIIKVSFDPTVGHEQAGYRPALVLSDKPFHKATGSVFCVPITSKKKSFLFEIEINGKVITGVALVHGSRMLDLTSRSFLYIESADTDARMKAQTIMTKIIAE